MVERAALHGARTALIAPEGTFTYGDLLNASAAVAAGLLGGAADLEEARVAYLVPPGFAYTAVQWGIWRAGGIAVPLALSHPPAELAYVIADSGAAVVIAHPDLADRVREAAAGRLVLTTDLLPGGPSPACLPDGPTAPDGSAATNAALPALSPERRALIIYTSGTTSRPKGVVTTHGNIEAQVTTLIEAWAWQPDDHILLTLPLHHIHGVINVLTCALWAGARVTVLPQFDAAAVWEHLTHSDLTLFMAVPTIYSRLIAAYDAAPPGQQAAMSAGCRRLRLMVSGSAALPVSVLERWREISGHVLLERYGMTEIGMALSNPLHGERRPGHVGAPLPGVAVRLVDESGEPVAPGQPGEIEVNGPSVFREYWGRPEATQAAFRPDGWFRTGDMAVLEGGAYRILGRTSVDIIKTGGYKVSALEIEEVLRTHPAIADCAVVGLEDPEWGERVAVAVVPAGPTPAGPAPGVPAVAGAGQTAEPLTLESLRQWAAAYLAPYKLPSRLLLLPELPRNAMGKVTKPEVVRLFPAQP